MKKVRGVWGGMAGLLLLVALVASGCATRSASPAPAKATETLTLTPTSEALHEGTPLTWEKIADDKGIADELWDGISSFAYMGHTPRLIVINEPEAVSTLRGKVLSAHLEQIASTDFSSFWVAVIHRGRETTTDYEPIEISDIRLQSNVITIYAQLYQEVFDERLVFIPHISPYYVLKIKKPTGIGEGKLAFTLKADDQVIPQMCAMKGEHLPWEKVVLGSGDDVRWSYGESSPKLVIITDREAISSVRDQLPPEHLELVAQIDFSTDFAAIIYRGQKVKVVWSVEVVDVKRQNNTIVICAQLHEHHPQEGVTEIQISPYYIMSIEKAVDLRGELNFVLTDNGEEVARQTKIIP